MLQKRARRGCESRHRFPEASLSIFRLVAFSNHDAHGTNSPTSKSAPEFKIPFLHHRACRPCPTDWRDSPRRREPDFDTTSGVETEHGRYHHAYSAFSGTLGNGLWRGPSDDLDQAIYRKLARLAADHHSGDKTCTCCRPKTRKSGRAEVPGRHACSYRQPLHIRTLSVT